MSIDYLYSSTIDERIEELEDQEELLDVEQEELDRLTEFRDDFDPVQWRDGITFIPERDFVEYARGYAEDIGAIEEDGRWPTYCIDWERAASDLSMDFTSVEFEGVDYYHDSY